MISKRYNRVIIRNTEIFACKLVGIYCQGVNAEQQILRNKISGIEGPGIRCQRGNRAKIALNTITDCSFGIEAVSSDPTIMMNLIAKSQESGIRILTKNELRADAVIKFNRIEKNLENGIILEGNQNFSIVDKNYYIKQNRKAGIKIMDKAMVKITNNDIFSNYG